VHDSRELAFQVLSWIIHACRGLSIIELQHALAIEEGTLELDLENITEVENLLSVRAGIVTVCKESGIIRLGHSTAQEYLGRAGKRWFVRAYDEISQACLTQIYQFQYLSR